MNHINTYNFIDNSTNISEVSSIQNDHNLLPDLVDVNMYSLDASFEYRKTYDLLNKSTEPDISQISPNNIPSDISNLFATNNPINIQQYHNISGGTICPIPTYSTYPTIYISHTNYLTQLPVPHDNTWVFCQDASLGEPLKTYPLMNYPEVLNNRDMVTNRSDNTSILSSSSKLNESNTVIDFSSNRSTAVLELDLSYGIFNKDVMNEIKWTPICINLSNEVLTPCEVLTRINSILLDVQKHLEPDKSIYIQYFASTSIRVDVSINAFHTLQALHTLQKFINTNSSDTMICENNDFIRSSKVFDNKKFTSSVDGSNMIIHHIIYGVSSDPSLISTATIHTPNILDESCTFVSKFIDINKVECFGGNSPVPNHNTYIYITPKVYNSNSPKPKIECNLDIFDTGFSASTTAPEIHDTVFNDYDSVFNDTNSGFNASTFRNNQVSSGVLNTKPSIRMQRPTRPPRRIQVNSYTPDTTDVFSSNTTDNTTDPFINYWGGNNCPFSFSTTGVYTVKNTKNIMTTAGIIVDGKYRENLMNEGVYNYIEKYTRTSGAAKDGLYCYNYTLDTNPKNIQPTGAINYSKFKKIELELTTISPPLNKDNTFSMICRTDERTKLREPIGVVQSNDNNYKYRFDIIFMEERYNIIKFIGGNVGLVFSN
jgi:hypothetical protein